MATLQIAHLSDLHILRDYNGSMLDRRLWRQTVPPVNYVLAGIREAVAARPDVIVLTGDLVHEGTEEDYRYLREVIERERGGIPVIPVLGNHDFKQAFYRGYLGEERTGSYTARYELGGYRFLVLDTAQEGNGCGVISQEQVQWLSEELAQPYGQGTILLGHHPFASRQAWFHTDYPNLWDRCSPRAMSSPICAGMPTMPRTARCWAFARSRRSPLPSVWKRSVPRR